MYPTLPHVKVLKPLPGLAQRVQRVSPDLELPLRVHPGDEQAGEDGESRIADVLDLAHQLALLAHVLRDARGAVGLPERNAAGLAAVEKFVEGEA
ncbi:MAG: hypothetical protein CL844_03705 [Crocinitomicaceae bacterium]|nr:hypothetical protein [Crocinitomicaceae bacterium]